MGGIVGARVPEIKLSQPRKCSGESKHILVRQGKSTTDRSRAVRLYSQKGKVWEEGKWRGERGVDENPSTEYEVDKGHPQPNVVC